MIRPEADSARAQIQTTAPQSTADLGPARNDRKPAQNPAVTNSKTTVTCPRAGAESPIIGAVLL